MVFDPGNVVVGSRRTEWLGILSPGETLSNLMLTRMRAQTGQLPKLVNFSYQHAPVRAEIVYAVIERLKNLPE